MSEKKLGFIGCGNMGYAILSGAIAGGALKKEDVYVHDISPEAQKRAGELGVNLCANNVELIQSSDIILLAIKPQQTKDALAEVGGTFEDKALISIVAGITSTQLRNMIEGSVRILRCMPNTPAMVNAGAFALCLDNDFQEEEKELANLLFPAIGVVEWIPEKLIDAVCGLSGGGPAYVAMFIEALSDGGVKQGLPRATAYRLAAQTVMGTAKLVLETGMHPGALKDMVTSPAGTTIAGVEELEKGAMRHSVMTCVGAATERSIQLGKI